MAVLYSIDIHVLLPSFVKMRNLALFLSPSMDDLRGERVKGLFGELEAKTYSGGKLLYVEMLD